MKKLNIFKTKTYEDIAGVCDLHCHILPGMDDGARDWNESAAMLKMAQEQGTRVLAATPHLVLDGNENRYMLTAQKAFEKLCSLQQEYAAQITTLLGFELYLGENIFTCENINRFAIGRSSTLLFETDTVCPPKLLADAVCWLLGHGITPLLAHPERIGRLKEIMPELVALCAKGLVLQINTSSITGGFGPGTMRHARLLARSGMPFVLGSDAHSEHSRPPEMRKAVERLQEWIGEARTREASSEMPRSLLNIDSSKQMVWQE